MRERVTGLRWLLAAGMLGTAACSDQERAAAPAGSLELTWTGSDTGKLSGPAVAEWCDSLDLLELRAIRGDTGIALLLYPSDSAAARDSVPPGEYPVVPPPRADTTRPSAAIALRWFAETSIRGFRGDKGHVVLESTGPGPSAGRFTAELRSATEGSRLTITGSFKGLTVDTAPAACAGRPAEEPDTSGEADEPEESDDAGEPPREVAD